MPQNKKIFYFFWALITQSLVIGDGFSQELKGNSSIKLICTGTQKTSWLISKEAEKSDKSFFVSVNPANASNKITIDGLSFYNKDVLKVSKAKDSLIELVTDKEFYYSVNFILDELEKGSGGTSSLSINRYTGTAKQNQMIRIVGSQGADVKLLDGEYSCTPAAKKMF